MGDLILDIYLKGISTRLSPEAPVPVVDVEQRTAFLGGAANTVCNLRSLGATVTYCTVIGDDEEGQEALDLLKAIGVSTGTIIKHPQRKTIAKTRVVSGSHVLARFDYGNQDGLDKAITKQLIKFIESNYPHYDAIVLSDYDKGIITEQLLVAIEKLQRQVPNFIVVDSKRLSFFKSLSPSLVKPNYEEVLRLLNLPHQLNGRIEQIRSVSELLFDKVNADIMAITLDAEGSVIAERGKPVHRCFAPAISSPHVAGAGDTYLSAFVLSYISCGDSKLSGEIATAAASIAVKKESTSVCSNAELQAYFNLHSKYVTSFQKLKEICDQYHQQGKRIVFTNGCFDILHSGHVTYLHCVKKMGDVLIIGINTDESVKRLKGESRPINPLEERLEVISGLSSVDHVIPFGDAKDDTPVSLIKIVKPHVFAKGGDYTKDKLPEASVVEMHGGEIVFIPLIQDRSTTNTIKRIKHRTPSNRPLKTALRI